MSWYWSGSRSSALLSPLIYMCFSLRFPLFSPWIARVQKPLKSHSNIAHSWAWPFWHLDTNNRRCSNKPTTEKRSLYLLKLVLKFPSLQGTEANKGETTCLFLNMQIDTCQRCTTTATTLLITADWHHILAQCETCLLLLIQNTKFLQTWQVNNFYSVIVFHCNSNLFVVCVTS